MNEVIVKEAQVESVEDSADGLRIKARLSQDGNVPTSELPYAFPLLPKTFQSVPKVGEGVFIITALLGNNSSNRFYIGPIISQPQYMNKDTHSYGRGSSMSLLSGGSSEPLAKISNYAETDGAFPNVNDVALVGRNTEDITLKDGEIDIRCGIREASIDDDMNLTGEVIFNKLDPSYIQLKHKTNLSTGIDKEANSMVNVVADKINIISHKDINGFNLTDQKNLINDEEIERLMNDLHKVPYGDKLVELLNLFRQAFLGHFHAYPGLPPGKDGLVQSLSNYNIDEIQSKHVRIS